METVSRSDVLRKLEKLRAFIERDCGNETINAQRIADRLIKEHNIQPHEFSYVHFSVKQKQDAAQARREAKEYERKQKAREQEQEFRVSFTSCMRDVVIALCQQLDIRYLARGGKVFIFCSASRYWQFTQTLDRVKGAWSRAVKQVNEELIEKIRQFNT